MIAVPVLTIMPVASADSVEVCQTEDNNLYYRKTCPIAQYDGGICLGYEYYYGKESGLEYETCAKHIKP